MIRILASAVVGLVANAIALIVGSLVLPEFSLGTSGFIVAVISFTGTGILIEPLLRQMAMKQLPVLLGSTALVSTLVGLIVTSLVTDSLSIDGLTTWLAAVVIVWVVALVARLLLPLVIFKKVLAERRSSN
ncbi:MAG: phage holin family protein [Acidimicrobiales bacterium]|nr:phage holin family protein [Acidimicrobiales bacterium]